MHLEWEQSLNDGTPYWNPVFSLTRTHPATQAWVRVHAQRQHTMKNGEDGSVTTLLCSICLSRATWADVLKFPLSFRYLNIHVMHAYAYACMCICMHMHMHVHCEGCYNNDGHRQETQQWETNTLMRPLNKTHNFVLWENATPKVQNTKQKSPQRNFMFGVSF